jgi:hypothetical protein
MRRRVWSAEDRARAEALVGIEPLDRPAKPPVCVEDHESKPERADVGYRLWVLMWVVGLPSGLGLVIVADQAAMPRHPTVWAYEPWWTICMVGFAPIALGLVALVVFLVSLFARWVVTGKGI